MSTRLTVIACCAAAFVGLTAGTAHARSHDRKSLGTAVLHQQEAGAMLRQAGLRWISSGHCTRRKNPHCTSFDGMRPTTLSGVLGLHDDSRCGVVISGGTEAGHSPGPYSHGAGYKLDVLPSRCIDRYIRGHYRRVKTRGDGARLYRAPSRALYARERSHWDILFM